MGTSIEQALTGLVNILTLARRPPPDPGSISHYHPEVAGLKRDTASLIMQHDTDAAGQLRLDGGDSANRTGVLSFCNSTVDQANLPAYLVAPGMMTRHPQQAPWNNPLNCSRDQLIAYIGGCWRAGRSDIVRSLLDAHAARVPPFTCQNIEDNHTGTRKEPPVGDLLAPHEIMYFRICAGDYHAALDLSGQLSLYLAILTTPSAVDTELNQIILLATVCGQLDIFVETHRNFPEALHNYWSGDPWRGQRPIATALIDVVNLESTRYRPVTLLDILLPAHLLEELRSVDLGKELQVFLSGNPFQFAQLSARFIVAALRDLQDHIELLVRSLATLDAVAREAAGALIVVLRGAAKQAFGEFATLLDQSRLDPTGISGIVLGVAASILGLGSAGDDAAEAEFRQRTTQQLNSIVHNTEVIIKAVADLQASMERHFAELTVFIAKEFDTLVLEELKGAIQDANILLNLSPAEKSASGYGDRVREDVSVLRRLISQVASNGPGTLGYCFQAYGIVVALLHAAGNSAGEIALTRAAYARNPFQTLLEAPEGPLMQWRALQKIAADETAVLNDLQREYLIGVRCVQWSKSVYRRPAPGKPMDDGPIEVGDKKWTITGYFARLAGDVAQTALIADAIAERELGLSETVLANRAAVQAFAPALLLADPLVFVWKYAGQPEHGSAADVAAASQARVARARLASQRSTESRRLQPDLEALVTGVKAAFAL